MTTPEIPEEVAPQQTGGRSLKHAVITALVLLTLIIVCGLLGVTAFFFLAFTVVLIALFEVFDGLTQTGRRPFMPFGMLCGAALLVVAFLEEPQLYPVVLIVTLYGSFVLAMRPNRGPTPVSDVGWTLLAVAWVAGGGAAAVSILKLPDGILLLVGFILTVALDDIGGYFAGTWFGKHKMAPSISPAKSWEGWTGGLLAAIAGGGLVALVMNDISLAEGVGLGVTSGLLAPVGDLSESMFKRQIGIKDSGRLLPGHGGLLDRLDAIIFCAPIAYLYLHNIAL